MQIMISFTTGLVSGTNNLDFVDQIDIYPNPVKKSGELTVFLDAQIEFEGSIGLYQFAGQQVHALNKHNFPLGTNRIPVKTIG